MILKSIGLRSTPILSTRLRYPCRPIDPEDITPYQSYVEWLLDKFSKWPLQRSDTVPTVPRVFLLYSVLVLRAPCSIVSSLVPRRSTTLPARSASVSSISSGLHRRSSSISLALKAKKQKAKSKTKKQDRVGIVRLGTPSLAPARCRTP